MAAPFALTPAQHARYLRRLGLKGSRRPTLARLAQLIRAHLRAVPFENFDNFLGRGLSLEREALVAKLVDGRRGGFCYELNVAFAGLLTSEGFEVELLSAQVAFDEGGFSHDFDHLALWVNRRWLVDVGFGPCLCVPLEARAGAKAAWGPRRLSLESKGGWLLVRQRHEGFSPRRGYRFKLKPQRLAAFGAMFRFHQRSKKSPFTHEWVCSRLLPRGGQVWIENQTFKRRGVRETRRELRDSEVATVLAKTFGVRLGAKPRRWQEFTG